MYQLEVEIDSVAVKVGSIVLKSGVVFQEDLYLQCVFGLLKFTGELSRAYDYAKRVRLGTCKFITASIKTVHSEP
ncbi:hypothetical protein PsorP6_010248 [Peronosclerospora sorghi]|uniref:Uncharacterized protein n=1 Tax=Peronosclerospora sorghi TaxID=230839 RepID=A0ACC0VW86_9STRA|nr:hypothetical protein PsorP6_010248 [Peronosclerospora sorghi]